MDKEIYGLIDLDLDGKDKNIISFSRFHWIVTSFNQCILEIDFFNHYGRDEHIIHKKEIKIFSFSILLNLLVNDPNFGKYNNKNLMKFIITIVMISLKFHCSLIEFNYKDIEKRYRALFKSNTKEFMDIESFILKFFDWDIKKMYTPMYYNEEQLSDIYNSISPLNLNWVNNIYNNIINNAES